MSNAPLGHEDENLVYFKGINRSGASENDEDQNDRKLLQNQTHLLITL